ncbi:AAA family ATPase [Streptomyces sp. NPDC051104]|uniref:AAA family ATPase n=1 Tax=Streptomyces sp. NPDC051104 TaxID=3155044 RepID=UPI0034394F1B
MASWNEAPENTLEGARRLLRTTFSPTTPIQRQEVFAGRRDQFEAVRDAVEQVGQHAVIYGDRGVGKTSLAMVSQEIARIEGYFTSLITCDSTVDFTQVWKQAFREILVTNPDGTEGDASYLLGEDTLRPDDVRLAFKLLSFNAPVVVFLDEYDTIAQTESGVLFANLVKILSDHGMDVTVVFVGVAEDVNRLIADHASVQRVLAEVAMPRMAPEERSDIVRRGLEGAGMSADDEVYERISLLSQGMPAIVHRLGQQSAFEALDRGSHHVTAADVHSAINVVVSKNMESVSTTYDHAVFSTRSDTLFSVVALACACVTTDEKGFFTSGALRRPLKKITGTSYEIPAYSAHLNDFSTKRGPLLEKVGGTRAYRYRFLNPLFKPYIALRALKENMITHEMLTNLLSGDMADDS